MQRGHLYLSLDQGACWVQVDVAAQHGVAVTQGFVGEVLGDPADDLVIKRDERIRVFGVDTGSGRWIVKQSLLSAVKLTTYHLLRRTPLWREWTAATCLRRHGIRCCQPLALIHHGARREWSQSIIMPREPGLSLHHVLMGDTPSEQWDEAHRRTRIDIMRAVGAQAGSITRRGLVNRDHKASNIMVDPRSAQPSPTVIDAAGLRVRRGRGRVERMFHRLFTTIDTAGRTTEAERIALIEGAIGADPSLGPAGAAALQWPP